MSTAVPHMLPFPYPSPRHATNGSFNISAEGSRARPTFPEQPVARSRRFGCPPLKDVNNLLCSLNADSSIKLLTKPGAGPSPGYRQPPPGRGVMNLVSGIPAISSAGSCSAIIVNVSSMEFDSMGRDSHRACVLWHQCFPFLPASD